MLLFSIQFNSIKPAQEELAHVQNRWSNEMQAMCGFQIEKLTHSIPYWVWSIVEPITINDIFFSDTQMKIGATYISALSLQYSDYLKPYYFPQLNKVYSVQHIYCMTHYLLRIESLISKWIHLISQIAQCQNTPLWNKCLTNLLDLNSMLLTVQGRGIHSQLSKHRAYTHGENLLFLSVSFHALEPEVNRSPLKQDRAGREQNIRDSDLLETFSDFFSGIEILCPMITLRWKCYVCISTLITTRHSLCSSVKHWLSIFQWKSLSQLHPKARSVISRSIVSSPPYFWRTRERKKIEKEKSE